MSADNLGDRMKQNYEDRNRTFLTRRIPVIIRLDGKAFHTLTKNCVKPFDDMIIFAMQATAKHLLDNIQGAKFVYVQSDEISILLIDYDKLETDAWFDYNVQKMCSISASVASIKFSSEYQKTGIFDSRVFNIPKEEVVNYFRWRFIDWKRNSVSMLAQSLFSHKALQGISSEGMKVMCKEKGVDYDELHPLYRFGTSFSGSIPLHDDFNSPEFLNYMNELVAP